MVDEILQPGKGLTFDVFEEEKVPAEGEVVIVKQELDDEGNPVPPMQFKDGEVVPKFFVVPEVVREQKIHFFKVPRLGSYMAIRLEYQTCLYEEAFDAGCSDMMKITELTRLQDDERQHHEKTQIEMKEQAEQDGETFKADHKKEWEKIEPKAYQTRKVQLVCCINTMGQDRKFTEQEKLFALRTVQRYRDRWEQSERDNLKADIAKKVACIEADKLYKEQNEALDIAELDIKAEASVALKEGQEPLTEDAKVGVLRKARFAAVTKTFYDPEGTIVH